MRSLVTLRYNEGKRMEDENASSELFDYEVPYEWQLKSWEFIWNSLLCKCVLVFSAGPGHLGLWWRPGQRFPSPWGRTALGVGLRRSIDPVRFGAGPRVGAQLRCHASGH
jgi:hypothetical protein